MKAEKFVEKKVYNNIMIRVYEIKPVTDFDIDLLLDLIEEVIGDDYEAQADAGTYYDFSGDWHNIDIDKITDKFTDYLADNNEDEEDYTIGRINDCIKFLEKYAGFIIYKGDD